MSLRDGDFPSKQSPNYKGIASPFGLAMTFGFYSFSISVTPWGSAALFTV